MKTVYIVRHAKSSWDFPHLSDHERPINKKGKKRTRIITDYLSKNKITIDLIISSHAVRASETAGIIARAIDYPAESIRIDRMIYHTNADRLIEQFFTLPNEVSSVMLVGHNPTLTNFVNNYLDDKIDWLPTSAVVCMKFNTNNWEDISMAKHENVFAISPRMLKNEK